MFSFVCFLIGVGAGWAVCYFWAEEKVLIGNAFKKDEVPK